MLVDWENELLNNITKADELKNLLKMSEEETERLSKTLEMYPMSISRYYLSLINFNDENDPIRKMCIPDIAENVSGGMKDTSGEALNTKLQGIQQKYPQTALILSTSQCAMYCSHCFRTRLVGVENNEVVNNRKTVYDFVSEHKEISNVLISGGDAFLNSNEVIEDYLKNLTEIPHLDLIRFGTRTPVVFPTRIYGDNGLLDILKKYTLKKRIIVVTQFCHPNEITSESEKAVKALNNIGVTVRNQAVLLKGINDNSMVIADLMRGLTAIGVDPYYIFQCRPVEGVKNNFQVPLLKGYEIVENAKKQLNGVSKSFRFVMSHETGKMEVLGSARQNYLVFKYHEAKNPDDYGKLFEYRIDAGQCWL